METPEIDKAHFERLQAGAAMLLPKAALDGVSAMLRSKYRFLAWEDFEAQGSCCLRQKYSGNARLRIRSGVFL